MFIAAANRSKHHASLGKQVYAACPELLPGMVEARVEPRPFESQVRHANHYTTESPKAVACKYTESKIIKGWYCTSYGSRIVSESHPLRPRNISE